MSIQHISQVIENSKARGTAKLVMILIANYADQDGIAWPSMARLAEQANVDVRTVKRTIRELVSEGEIEVIGNGKCNVNKYRICCESRDTDVPTVDGDKNDSRDTGVTTSRDTGVTRVGTLASPEPSRTVNKPSLSCAREVDEKFERFWNAYPKREGGDPKKPTLKKFEIACRKTDPENIIHAAEQYAARIEQEEAENPRRKPRRFVPMAKTWLHQERWEEYPRENPDDVHRLKMRKLAEDIWPSIWGPRPGEPGCDIPPHILQEFGMEGVLQ